MHNLDNFEELKKNFYLNDIELVIKGGGIGGYVKCMNSLWQSKDCLVLCVGKKNTYFSNTIYVRNIKHRMKNLYQV